MTHERRVREEKAVMGGHIGRTDEGSDGQRAVECTHSLRRHPSPHSRLLADPSRVGGRI